jgi:GH15 family glucan-1,4-alpha-glucosidase
MVTAPRSAQAADVCADRRTAAPTTSLPEQLGGERNWDYRYVWVRDAAFCVYALLRLGFTEEANAFGDFLARLEQRTGSPTGPFQVMYGIDGRTVLPEVQLDHLDGYQGSAPVRVGNSAAAKLQLDIYGALSTPCTCTTSGGRLFRVTWDGSPPRWIGSATTGTS